MFAGFCFNNIFCAATNLAASTVFFCPIPETENDGWWFLFGATAGCFEQWNVCWAHPVISRASAVASNIFHGVIPDAFEVRRIVCVEIKQTLNNELKFHIVNIY